MAGRVYFLSWMSGRLLKSLKYLVLLVLLFASLYLINFYAVKREAPVDDSNTMKYKEHIKFSSTVSKKASQVHFVQKEILKTTTSTTSALTKFKTNKAMKETPCYNLHAFYYPWYGHPDFDNKYLHWNHQFIPHWNKDIANNYPLGAHKPPDDVGSDFYPSLGAYSSRNPSVVSDHMAQLASANIGVIMVSYYPPNTADDNGQDWQDIFPILLEKAAEYKIKVGFHIEPYKDRNEQTVRNDLKYIVDTYSSYSAFFTYTHKGKSLPMIYIYDSYHTRPEDWQKILSPDGIESIRGTSYDAHVIGLFVKDHDGTALLRGGFDGFYTYFAANGFTYGSTRNNWQRINLFAVTNSLIFIPSVGPGYIDTRVRPWNGENTRNRLRGGYYKDSWNEALKLNPKIISITSFNEWHEGTQIEKAIPHIYGSYTYRDYKPQRPDYYLHLTKSFSKDFAQCAVQ